MGQFSYSALKQEVADDPAALGYAGKARAQAVALLNTRADQLVTPQSWTKVVPLVPLSKILLWGAKSGVRKNVEAAATNASSPVQAIALAVRDLLIGASATALDTSDPQIVGTGGLLDALVSAGVITSQNRSDLIALQNQPCSRAEELWGAGTVISDDDLARAN